MVHEDMVDVLDPGAVKEQDMQSWSCVACSSSVASVTSTSVATTCRSDVVDVHGPGAVKD